MIPFYNLDVKFDGCSLQGLMRTFPLLCIYERSEIKLTCEVLFVSGRDKKERLVKSTTYSLQCILHTEIYLPWWFEAVPYRNRKIFCTEKYFCQSHFCIKVHTNFICIYYNIKNISLLFDFSNLNSPRALIKFNQNCHFT